MKYRLLTALLLLATCILQAKERIAVVTMSIGHEYTQLVEKAIENKREYCQRHGYDFIVASQSLDPSRPHPWSKIKLVEQCLADYDWVFWSNADSVVMNMDCRLEDIIDNNYMMVVAEAFGDGINTGQFLLKNSPESFEFLKQVYALDQWTFHGWWEQMAIIDHLSRHPEVHARLKYVPARTFNSARLAFRLDGRSASFEEEYVYHPGDFIVHFAGFRGEKMKVLIEEYAILERLLREYKPE